MNCTRCGVELKKAICEECNADHKNLLYKMADDCQTRREYKEAMEYYELIKSSTDSTDELNDISRTMAKLGFSLTDLTGNDLQREKIKGSTLRVLKGIFIGVIMVSLVLIIYKVYMGA